MMVDDSVTPDRKGERERKLSENFVHTFSPLLITRTDTSFGKRNDDDTSDSNCEQFIMEEFDAVIIP